MMSEKRQKEETISNKSGQVTEKMDYLNQLRRTQTRRRASHGPPAMARRVRVFHRGRLAPKQRRLRLDCSGQHLLARARKLLQQAVALPAHQPLLLPRPPLACLR